MTEATSGEFTGYEATFDGRRCTVGSVEDGRYRVFFESGRQKTLLVDGSHLRDLRPQFKLVPTPFVAQDEPEELYRCKGVSAIAMRLGIESGEPVGHMVAGPAPYEAMYEQKITCKSCQTANQEAIVKTIDAKAKAKRAARKSRKARKHQHASRFMHSATYGPSR